MAGIRTAATAGTIGARRMIREERAHFLAAAGVCITLYAVPIGCAINPIINNGVAADSGATSVIPRVADRAVKMIIACRRARTSFRALLNLLLKFLKSRCFLRIFRVS